MVLYRRNRVAGGTYFFTVTLRDRRSNLLIRQVGLLREAFRLAREKWPYIIDAIVVLPDHLHTIWTLPDGDADYSKRWRAIKSSFIQQLRKLGIPLTTNHRGEYRLWQRRFWEHTIRDDNDFQRHVDYIHWNPVKHGLVECLADWPYSSFHKYQRLGLLPPNWATTINENQSNYGE